MDEGRNPFTVFLFGIRKDWKNPTMVYHDAINDTYTFCFMMDGFSTFVLVGGSTPAPPPQRRPQRRQPDHPRGRRDCTPDRSRQPPIRHALGCQWRWSRHIPRRSDNPAGGDWRDSFVTDIIRSTSKTIITRQTQKRRHDSY